LQLLLLLLLLLKLLVCPFCAAASVAVAAGKLLFAARVGDGGSGWLGGW